MYKTRTLLDRPEEIELIRKLVEFPTMVGRAADTREPHHVAYYLRDLAGLWNPYLQDGINHRVVSDDEGLTQARLALVKAVRIVLKEGLGLLGVSSPERMRTGTKFLSLCLAPVRMAECCRIASRCWVARK